MELNETWPERLAAEAIAMETTLFDEEAVYERRSRTYRLLEGRVPVALSAPHAIRQPRAVVGSDRVLHRSEPYTGPLAIQLHRATGAWAIYATRTARYDPNHASFSTYKRYGLRALIERAAPRLIIDLHGTGALDFAVAIGTSPLLRDGRAQQLVDLIAGRLAAALDGAVLVDAPPFRANNPHTVAAHCWATFGIPSVQLEISRGFRSPRHYPVRYAALHAALCDIIEAVAAGGG